MGTKYTKDVNCLQQKCERNENKLRKNHGKERQNSTQKEEVKGKESSRCADLQGKWSKKGERCTTKEVHEIWYILPTNRERGEKMRYLVGQVRSGSGISLRRLAQQARISKSYLQRIEAGEAKPSLETMVRLARALNTPVEGLYRAE